MKPLIVRFSINNELEEIALTPETMDTLHDSLHKFEQQLFSSAAEYMLTTHLALPASSTPKIKIKFAQ